MNGQDHLDPAEAEGTVKGPNGLTCFLDDTRECGPDCMAYITDPETVEKTVTLSPQQKNCVLIVSVERLGRYVGAGVSMMKKDRDDRQRAEHLKITPNRPRST